MKWLVLFAWLVVGLTACGDQTATQSSPAAPDKSSAPVTTAASKPPPVPQTLLEVSGSGAKKTQNFVAAGNWDLTWQAKDISGFGCYFGVYVYNADSNTVSGVAVNQQVKGAQFDVDHEHKGGRYYLDVNAANCDWSLKVTG